MGGAEYQLQAETSDEDITLQKDGRNKGAEKMGKMRWVRMRW